MSSKIFFVSDTHFGHQLLADIRGFDTVQQMDEKLIERWNTSVAPNDHVYHLGDFAFGRVEYIRDVARRLHGKLFFVKGNHDHQVPRRTMNCSIDFLPDLCERRFEDQRVVLCHYPVISWNRMNHGAWMLHGHCHGSLEIGRDRKLLDVGVDAHELRPWSIEEIAKVMSQRATLDHHKDRK